ncbi:MAG: efflux RND transporter periplasmic adaptor subunit [Sphingosinicella sp.]|uniref:efflux RND transporter periplasmic adaptor subunit n=1 Tax=Sphingosinicella sp. TaxID=1917971 RepID=UPI0040378539
MLRDDDFAIEVTVFEEGVPPEYRLYAYRDGQPVPPGQVQAAVTVRRLDGEVNRFAFRPEQDYLRGNATLVEPHSFDVEVVALEGGRRHVWRFPSYEGRTTIGAEAARAAGIRIERVGPGVIDETVEVVGRVELDPGATAEVGARFPGRVVAVAAHVGDRVRRGQLLARIESSESLQTYSVYAPMTGVVAERRTNVGDVTGSDPLFVLADPGRTMAVFPIFPRDMERIRPGQPVQLGGLEGNRAHASIIRDFRPEADAMTGATQARVPLPNPDGFWRAGMSVRGRVTIARRQVPLAVRTEALQQFRDFTVVFAQVGNTYEVRMLELGARTPEWTEVLGGIRPGQPYAAEGSYVIKADIERSGASHDH